MGTATNIDAAAVNTIRWLATGVTSIVVPVYQRQYRWDIGGCEQLLADIRAVADADGPDMHFIGSILSGQNSTSDDSSQLVLIDGQQRITTLMLLIAALHHIVGEDDPALASEFEAVLIDPRHPKRTKLRPHRAWADTFESVVLGRFSPGEEPLNSRFDDNYAFFRSQVRPAEVARIWRGLQRLEHVTITIGAGANAQQIFESLNSTGEPLRDHELIHNYVLMGLSHAEQLEIEENFWAPIERNTGDAIAGFWRHYLVMATGREVSTASGRGVYDAFRQRFPQLDLATLRSHGAQWRDYSEAYRTLLDPAQATDSEIARHLRHVNTFGRSMYPLVMRAYQEYAIGAVDAAALVTTLQQVQSLLLRRTVVGTGTDRLVARLCRARAESPDAFARAIARITPSDERVRVALRYGELPHPAYVLGRLASHNEESAHHDAVVEHVFPLLPSDGWSGDGVRTWSEYTDDEQNSHRALAPTLGNLALLEDSLAERAIDLTYPEKLVLYARSGIPVTRELADIPSWGTAAIAARTARLTTRFLEVWAKPDSGEIDDDGLTPILDAQRRRGWPHGWEREFEYVEYRGEHWEVYDVKYLFNRIFTRLWADSRQSVVDFSADRGGPLYDAPSWHGQWDTLDADHHLYMGWDAKYMLSAVQGVLDEAGLAPEVFVKYSYIAPHMAS